MELIDQAIKIILTDKDGKRDDGSLYFIDFIRNYAGLLDKQRREYLKAAGIKANNLTAKNFVMNDVNLIRKRLKNDVKPIIDRFCQ